MPGERLQEIFSKSRRRLRAMWYGPKKRKKYKKGVFNGNYYRIAVQEKQPNLPNIPKLPSPVGAVPKPFRPAPPNSQNTSASSERIGEEASKASSGDGGYAFFRRLQAWWKENWAVSVLNFGSIMTLTAFTRSDVLELRTFSLMGSVCYIFYNFTLVPRRLAPILWSALFAAVNGWKIGSILQERNASVVMDAKQEEIFVEYFMNHGLTPKQFEILYNRAEIVKKRKGTLIIRQGEPMKYVYLVTEGSTRASILGRHLTAASSGPQRRAKVGGDSGAWIGEMSFLEDLFAKEKAKTQSDSSSSSTTDDSKQSSPSASSSGPAASDALNTANRNLYSLYTIVAAEDCTMLRWSHKDLANVMNLSVDFRSAMTRAMTSAIVGKVINFTVHRQKAIPTWSTWLDEVKHRGERVEIREEETDDEVEDSDDLSESKSLSETSTAGSGDVVGGAIVQPRK